MDAHVLQTASRRTQAARSVTSLCDGPKRHRHVIPAVRLGKVRDCWSEPTREELDEIKNSTECIRHRGFSRIWRPQ